MKQNSGIDDGKYVPSNNERKKNWIEDFKFKLKHKELGKKERRDRNGKKTLLLC